MQKLLKQQKFTNGAEARYSLATGTPWASQNTSTLSRSSKSKGTLWNWTSGRGSLSSALNSSALNFYAYFF
jgi:hypothetical protein